MKNRIINEYLEKIDFNRNSLPIDLFFLSEKKNPNINESKEIVNILVKDINYIGQERISSISKISLIFNPENLL
jgi:hypothetical protein